MPTQLIGIEAVAKQLGVPVETLRYWRKKKVGPASARIGRHVVYRAEDVEAWIAKQFDQPAATDASVTSIDAFRTA